jgi:MHS family shikimate/dehydroshikimate transporter-like MFS transporter
MGATFDPMVGTLLAFATYALGFVARPLDGLIFVASTSTSSQ